MSSVKLDALRAQVEILRHVKQREAELKELKAQAREQIEELMAHSDADEGTIDGRPVITRLTGAMPSGSTRASEPVSP